MSYICTMFNNKTKNMQTANIESTDSVVASSTDFEVSTEIKRKLIQALNTIKENKDIKQCQIDGSDLWNTTKLFDSTIDDPERKEIEAGSFDDFPSDIQEITIRQSGAVSFTAYNKWIPSETIKFEIE